jgi:putative ubiquitin-RnfH superfamily antitoxin RatB of RatAB toxin-antitoxin module
MRLFDVLRMSMPEIKSSDFCVEVAYARPDRQRIRTVTVAAGTTVREALLASGLAEEFPEIDPACCSLGIFGQSVAGEREVCSGERVEIYRPLLIDPKEARRRLATEGLTIGHNRDFKE